MKRNILLACICAMIGFSACDNYLDVTPKGKDLLKKTEDYLGLLEMIDNSFPVNDFGYVANETTRDNRYDLEGYKYPTSSSGFFWNEDFDRASFMTEGQDCSELYNKCYARIARYNILIENIMGSEGEENDKIRGLAQAKLMRAYNYFFLLNTFAKPYNPATADTDNGILVRKQFDNLTSKAPQYTVAETYAFILQDINESINDLPEQAASVIQPDKAFGYAFRAKVYLFMRKFDKALEDALEVLKFPNHQLWNLSADFKDYIAKNPYVAMIYPNEVDQWHFYGMQLMHPFNFSENLLYGYNNVGGSPVLLREHIKKTFDATSDLRYNVICNTTATPPNPEPGCLYFQMNTIIMVNESGIRLSEVYLMIAECYAREGNIGLTLKYLNDLRKTRIATNHYKDLIASDVENNKDKALTYVREERIRELFSSCNSFFDMRRFCTEFNETLTKTYIDTNNKTHTYTLKPDSHLLTFPFPRAAMQNSNLIQNSK